MNRLLRALSPGDLALVEPNLTRLRLSAGEHVVRSGAPVRSILFPDSATLILSVPGGQGPVAAVGIVGREGFLGWSAVLGDRTAPLDATVCPGGGMARAIDVAAFAHACAASAALMGAALRFAQVMADQLASSVATALTDTVATRLARWLLMLHDRHDGDDLNLTHDDLAVQLATRRATVTDALHLLEGDHVLRCARGRITVQDRAALERAAGVSYGAAETRYRTLLSQPFSSPVPRMPRATALQAI